jgi:hypothetical protein
MAHKPIKPIRVGTLSLEFDPHVAEDGTRIVVWSDDITGEKREQVVERVPENPRWRDTVARRMMRYYEDEQTPQVLLMGVR